MKKEQFIHNKNTNLLENIREIIFGSQDGMVSTLGSLTGIAIASSNATFVIISGFVIIAVESISMGIGAYLSNQSAKEVEERKVNEEKFEIDDCIKTEGRELFDFFRRDGWSRETSKLMTKEAKQNKNLMLKEMSYRELKLFGDYEANPIKNGIFMFLSYIVGGIVPLLPYFFLTLNRAVIVSITLTLFGLFLLGALTAKVTHFKWWKAGLRMLILAGIATLVGCLIGNLGGKFKH